MPYRQSATYREWEPPVALRPWLQCVWLRDTGSGEGETVRVLPDACTDLMWIDGELQVAGPDTAVNPAPRPPGGRIVGVRFRPGMMASLVGVDTAQLTDLRIDLDDLWGHAAAGLRERIGGQSSVPTVANELLRAVTERVVRCRPPDPLAQAVVGACQRVRGPLAVRRLAGDLGVSERQLRRRALAAFGYGPKTLDRILRFQRFLRLTDGGPRGRLAVAAAQAGYADQAHLTRECQRLAGLSPAALVAERAR